MTPTISLPIEEQAPIDWIAENTGDFELMVISTALHDPEVFHEHMARVLCLRKGYKEQLEWVDDFSSPILCALYRVLCDYHWMMAQVPGREYDPISDMQAMRSLQGLHQIILSSEIPRALELLKRAREIYTTDVSRFVKSGLKLWMRQQKTARVTRDWLLSGKSTDLKKQLEEIDAVCTNSKELEAVNPNDELDSQDENIVRMPTGLLALDRPLRGGFGRGESYLFIAAQAAGKTVLATQLAGSMAAAGMKVGLITTEQRPKELAFRMVSAQCSVPFNLVVDGFDMKRIPIDRHDRVLEFRKILSERIRMVHWDADRRQQRIQDHMDIIVKKFQEGLGGLDVLILDWLGRALGDDASYDPAKLRLAMKAAAGFTADCAARYNVATVDFAQADPTRGYDRLIIDASCIAECRSLGESKTGVIGITAFHENADEALEIGRPVFKTDQCFYFAKSRKSEGEHSRIRREFKFQRFADVR